MKITQRAGILISLFISFSRPVFSQLIITEIFADPSPSHGLPEKEFIEIYNIGNEPVPLKGHTLAYAASRSSFPDVNIRPNEYIIVCRKGNEGDFQKYGKVISLSSFSLLNEGTLLVIQDEKVNDVFSVKYLSSWYSEGRDQGFSLEMIDKNYACRGKQNWTSSRSPSGATPGAENSVSTVLPDVQGPEVADHNLEGRWLTLEFNEKLNLSTAVVKANFKPDPASIQVAGISSDKYESEYVKVELSRLLNQNEIIELDISKVEDCSGNVMQPVKLRIGNFLPPDSSEILISEVLFNPRTGGYDFVEIYNNSDKNINLKDWFLAKRDQKGEFDELSILRNKDLVVGPGQYLALTENKGVLMSEYPNAAGSAILQIPSLPSLPAVAGSIILMNDKHKIFDEFSYFEDMHHPMLDDKKGVSLERVSFNVTASSIENWKSSSFSGHFSTPGYKNSQNDTNLSPVNIFYAEPAVFFPRSKGDTDKTCLKFSLKRTGNMMTVRVLDSDGRIVKNLLNNELTGGNGEVSWDGTDNSGLTVPTGYYLFHIELSSPSGSETHLIKMVSGAY